MDSGTYCAGMAIATPFAAATLPYPWFLLSLIVTIPFVVHYARNGIHLPKIGSIPLGVWLLLLLCLFHVHGVWRSYSPFESRVLVDILIVAAGLGVFLLGWSERDDSSAMLKGFFAALVPFTVVMATIGLVKAALLQRGILLGFILARYPDQYPPGSSLRSDINLFGLSMLVAGLGLASSRYEGKDSRYKTIFQALGLAVIVAAGMLSESRRFIVLATLIPIVWLVQKLSVNSKYDLRKKVLIPVIGLIGAIGVLFWVIHSQAPIETAVVLNFPGMPPSVASQKQDPSGTEYEGKPENQDLTVRKTDFTMIFRLLGTLGADQAYGFESRIEKWRLGIRLLKEGAWLRGMGFAYHEVFSCRFADCEILDYPHLPILSEWLVAGVPGVMTALAIYFLLFQSIWRSGRDGWKSGLSAIALATIPYSLISGDTIFSIPQFIIICLLAQCQQRAGKQPTRAVAKR
jgi:hypothetical protein